MNENNVKKQAQVILDKLPENATWDDLMYEIYVHKSIESGLRDSKEGRIIKVKDIRAKFGL